MGLSCCSILGLLVLGCGAPDDKPEDRSGTDEAGSGTPDTSGLDSGDEGGSDQDTGLEADTAGDSLSTLTIWPASPYPDSPLQVLVDGVALSDGCTWSLDGVDLGEGCSVLGETLGLEVGMSLVVAVGESSEGVTVRSRPDLLVTETMASPGRVTRFDADGLVVSQVSLSGAMPFTMPVAIAVWEGAAYLTEHLGYLNGQGIHRLEGEPLELAANVDSAGLVYWAAVDEVRGRLLVSDVGRTAITPYAIPSLEVGVPVELSIEPVSVRVQGDVAWVACQDGGTPAGGDGTGGGGGGGGAGGGGGSGAGMVAPGSKDTSTGRVVRIDLTTDEAVEVEVGSLPYWAEPSPDGSLVAVADEEADVVMLLDAESLSVVNTFSVGEAPTGLAWSLDGEELFVALYTGGLLVALDPETGGTLRSWDLASGEVEQAGVVGVFPRDDGRYLYVPVLHENRVAVVDTQTEAEPVYFTGVDGPRGVALWED